MGSVNVWVNSVAQEVKSKWQSSATFVTRDGSRVRLGCNKWTEKQVSLEKKT